MAFRLKDRDREIIKAVNTCRVLETRHIQDLFFGSPKPCYGRLKKLYENGFLERHYLTKIAAAPAASTLLYSLTKLGAEVLAATYAYTSEDLHFASKTLLNPEKLPHTMAINDFWVAVNKATHGQEGVRVVEWIDELTFRADPDYVYVKGAGGRRKRKPLLPDGYLVLRTPQGTARFFVELDRGTEGLTQFRSQIEVYTEYMVSGRYQQRFKSTSLRILVVSTSTQRRLDNLKKAVEQAGGGERYLFGCFKPPYPPALLNAPLWQKLGSRQLYGLLAPAP